MNILKKYRLELILYIASVFFLRIPIISIQGIPLFSTHVLAVCLILFLFLKILFHSFKDGKSLLPINTEIIIILIFFLTQAFSSIYAVTITSFLNRFIKLSIGIVIFIISRYYVQKYPLYSILFNTLLLSVAVTGIFQLFLLVLPESYFQVMNLVQQSNLTSVTQANIYYQKLFDDTFVEAIIPIAVYQMQAASIFFVRGFATTILYATFILAFVSNFRYRLVSAIFSIILSLFTLTKQSYKKFLPIVVIASVIILFILLDRFLLNIFSFTIIDRLLLRSSLTDTSSITWRFQMAKESIDMAKAFITGVGLGNFLDNLPYSNVNFTLFSSREVISEGALSAGPHNIFFQTLAETGFPGFITLVAMLLTFLYKDFTVMRTNQVEKKPVIISFWTLIVMLQFFPGINLSFYALFFLLRALI